MKLIKRLSLAVLTSVLAIPAFAATSLTNLVSDQAPAYVCVEDFPQLVKQWQHGPWMRAWNDEQLKKFFAPLRAEMKIEEWDEKTRAETGLTVQELVGLATGEVFMALTDLSFAGAEQVAGNMPVLFAVTVGGNAGTLEKLILAEQAKEEAKQHDGPHAVYSVETFADATIHIEEKTRDGVLIDASYWSITDGVFLFAGSKTVIQSAIDGLKKDGVTNALGRSEVFLKSKKRTGDASVIFSANFRTIIPVVQQLIAAKEAKNEKPNPMMNPNAIIPALGLDAIEDIFMGVSVGDDATIVSGGITYSEQRGLLKMLAYHDGPPAYPTWVPAKTITVNTMKFSLRDMYAALEETVGAYNPMILNMGQMYLQQFNQKLGFDIKRDFFGSFGDVIVSGNLPRLGVPADKLDATSVDTFVVLSLDNPKALTSVLEALRNQAGEQADKVLPKREYMGSTVYTITLPNPNPAAPAQTVSYTVAKNNLVLGVGSPASIESVLQCLNGEQPSIWERPEVKRAMSEVPAGASTFSYQDTRLLMGIIFETLAKLPPQTRSHAHAPAEGEVAEATEPTEEYRLVDPAAKPDSETIAKYWSDAFGYGERDAHGIYFKSTLNHKK